ncbi:amphoterin-induced protein 1 [Dendroctonus ponderosae]|uniref:LRRNT domain-containing protein n=1 Tax=Dendroctonus ponderosae TaxID=77166 RepID=U4USL7_DENPD|nr:amphoterin-induced protein 1 [Dendroctonus ponderosae]ERL95513.1 hypothetical protein D910_12775 [Dendroctonus ponderosae]
MRSTIINVSVLLSVWTAAGQTECPPGCNCSESSLSCIDQRLENVPDLQALDFVPLVLDLSGNMLLSVSWQDFDFPNNEEVKEVYLNSSSLTEIAEDTFASLEGLQGLYLGENELSTVPETLIANLENMVLLDLSSNYINGALPTIRSESLEVLAFIDSKILSIPASALSFLPNLRLLLLQQNSIQTLSMEPFQSFEPNAIFVNLLFNAWTCSCDNMQAFHRLSDQNFIDSSEPYQCSNSEDEIVSVFEAASGSTEMCEDNKGPEVHEVLDQVLMTPAANYSEHLIGNEHWEQKENAPEPEGCWDLFINAYAQQGFLHVILITTIVSFLIGFVFGVLSCKLLYTLRYKKLEQSSDSQVQLL